MQHYVENYARRTVPAGFVASLFGIEMNHLDEYIEKLDLLDKNLPARMLSPADVTIITWRLSSEDAESRVHEHLRAVSDIFYSACDISTEPDDSLPSFKLKRRKKDAAHE